MNEKTGKLLHWTPRVLAIAYAIFVSLFALDVWSMDGGFWEKLGGFLIHLAPTYVIVALIVLAWVRPLIGGVLFCILALVFTMLFGWEGEWQTLLFMATPLLIIGLLFFWDGRWGQDHLQPGY